MRVLVVNAHAKSHECQKAFQDLLSCVKESLKAYNGLLEIKDECVIRTKDNLEDYLYDECTSFSQPNFGKQFDSLDFVIVSGDLHILPWHPSNHKVLTLLRMCIRVKKCLFAIGFAMQALVYLSASNLDGPINVINGDGKGGKLGDIGQLQTQKKIGPHDNFLDSVTGDLYYFQQEANEWAPLCNVGLHHARTAQEFNTLGKFVIKTPIYRPKKSIHNSEGAAIFDESVERKCYIKKIYLNHWLFHNVDGEFIVPYRGRWEVHSFNFTNKAKAFDILAESEQGALIIEYPRIVGLKFLVSKRYKESFQIFSNFFTRYADQVRCTGKSQSLSILSYNSFAQTQARMVKFQTKTPFGTEPSPRNYRSGTASGPQKTKGLKNIGSLSELPTASVVDNHIEHQVFKHSGMATKMKGKLILDHNYIATGKLRHDTSPLKSHDDRSKLFSKDYSARKNPLSSNRVATDDDFSFLESHRDAFSKMERKSILKTPSSKPHNRNVSKDLLSQDSPYMIGRAQTEEDSALSKADVRKWLYPELKEVENPFEKKNWIPGNMSKTRVETIYDSKPIRVGTSATDYRKKGSVPAISLNPESQRSLRSSEPYVTSYELTREYQKKEDGKILGGRKFVLSKGPPSIGSVSPSSRFGMSETSRQRDWY